MDGRLLNGKPKVTVIQRFDHSTIVLGPEFGKRKVFDDLEDLKHFIQRKGWEVNVSHIHPAHNETTQGQN